MSKNKSLGSSPVGLNSNASSMGFIPDLGVDDSKKETTTTTSGSSVKERKKEELHTQSDKKSTRKEKKNKKKVVSYNLEVELIDKIKSIANQKDIYYSTFVSMALKSWISRHNQS